MTQILAIPEGDGPFDMDFGLNGGGMHRFENLAALHAPATEEAAKWTENDAWKSRSRVGSSHLLDVIERLPEVWTQIAKSTNPRRYGTQSAFDIQNNINGQIAASLPISARTTQGAAILHVIKNNGASAAGMAVKCLVSKPEDPLVSSNGKITKDQFEGILAYHDAFCGYTTQATESARRGYEALVSRLQAESASREATLQGLEESHNQAIRDLNDLRDQDRQTFQQYQDQLQTDSDNLKAERKKQWDELVESYTEKLRIETSVSLWTKRGEEHSNEAVRSRNRLWVIGLFGGILAGLVSWGAVNLAERVFSGGIVAAKAATESGLRPTFHYELVLAAGVTLLYLTLYLWSMRVLMRMYMTEHHLKIDAYSRANMAQTYLALVKDKAAGEADRHIVLASLFRPVVDGIVKDDAMPIFTPGAFLSSGMSSDS